MDATAGRGKRRLLTLRRQLKLLMWKNFLMINYRKRAIIVFIGIPLCMAMCMVISRFYIDAEKYPQRIYNPIPGNELMNRT